MPEIKILDQVIKYDDADVQEVRRVDYLGRQVGGMKRTDEG